MLALATSWRSVGVSALRLRGLALLAVPSLLSIITWFTLLPPSFRFIWGPAFALPCAIAGWCVWRIHSNKESLRRSVEWCTWTVGITLVLVAAVCAVTRLHPGDQSPREFVLGPVRVPYHVSLPPTPRTTTVTSEGGVMVRMPVGTDQCWTVYPLCTPELESSLRSRGPSINDGFTP